MMVVILNLIGTPKPGMLCISKSTGKNLPDCVCNLTDFTSVDLEMVVVAVAVMV